MKQIDSTQPQPSRQEVEVLRAGFHSVDEQFVSAVEAQNNQLQEPAIRVETQPELAGRVVVIQVSGTRRDYSVQMDLETLLDTRQETPIS